MRGQLFLALIDDDGRIARYSGGEPAEVAFMEACVTAIVARNVGIFRTEAQVTRAVQDGITEVVRTLKKTSRYTV